MSRSITINPLSLSNVANCTYIPDYLHLILSFTFESNSLPFNTRFPRNTFYFVSFIPLLCFDISVIGLEGRQSKIGINCKSLSMNFVFISSDFSRQTDRSSICSPYPFIFNYTLHTNNSPCLKLVQIVLYISSTMNNKNISLHIEAEEEVAGNVPTFYLVLGRAVYLWCGDMAVKRFPSPFLLSLLVINPRGAAADATEAVTEG